MFSRVGLPGIASFTCEVGQIVPNKEIKAMSLLIRPETAADLDAIRHVNCLAFGQDEEARLVNALRESGFVRLSLVAEQAGQVVVGHILFSDLPIITDAGI